MIRKHNCVNICEDMTLTQEQTSAIKKLSKLRAGALFMEMGTGKTRTMIELTKLRTDYDVIAWIAPAALIKDAGYIAEVNKWQPNKPIVFYSEDFTHRVGVYIDVTDKVFGVKKKCGNITTITQIEVVNDNWDKAFTELKEFLKKEGVIL